MQNAADPRHVTGACFVFQPGVPEKALRVRGASRDFTHAHELMLQDLAGGQQPEPDAG